MVPEVRMSVEEYLELFGRSERDPNVAIKKVQKISRPKPKRKGKAAKGMGRAMREANKRLRTKTGKLRKGKTQADVARLAHKIRRKKYA